MQPLTGVTTRLAIDNAKSCLALCRAGDGDIKVNFATKNRLQEAGMEEIDDL